MNNEWITDRSPTEDDADSYGWVWATYDGKVDQWNYDGIFEGTPWMPITPPEPYVKPKRYVVVEYYDCGTWTVQDTKELCLVCRPLPTREAAEEFAAIYERVNP